MRTGSAKHLVVITLISALLSSTAAYMSLSVAQLSKGVGTEENADDSMDDETKEETDVTETSGETGSTSDDTDHETGEDMVQPTSTGTDDTGSANAIDETDEKTSGNSAADSAPDKISAPVEQNSKMEPTEDRNIDTQKQETQYQMQTSGKEEFEDVILPWNEAEMHDAAAPADDAYSEELFEQYFTQDEEADGDVYRTVILPTPDALMNLVGEALEQLGRFGVLLQQAGGSQHASSVVEDAIQRLGRGGLTAISVEEILRDTLGVVSDALMHGAAPAAPKARPVKNILEDLANLLQLTIPDIFEIFTAHKIPLTDEILGAYDQAKISLLQAIPPCRDSTPECDGAIDTVLNKMDGLRDIMERAMRTSPEAEKIERAIEAMSK